MRGKAGTQNIFHENLASGKSQLLLGLIKGGYGRACYLTEIDVVKADNHQVMGNANPVMFSGVYNCCREDVGRGKDGIGPILRGEKLRDDGVGHGITDFRNIYNLGGRNKKLCGFHCFLETGKTLLGIFILGGAV